MMMKENLCNIMHGLKPTLLMIMVQIAFAGVNILYKLAVNDGMNLRIVVAYRFIFATVFIAPLAFFLERKKRAKMTWTILFQSFLCGLFGFCFEEKQNKCLLVVKMWNCDVQGRGGFCGPWARTRGFEPTSDWALLIAELGLELVKNKFKGNEKRGGEKF
ncbi:hypothetical protein TSUD_390190 [Trifolium subterraneum]|uniref:WAT1-related protein n=1 Tax=Trifolium subterraneum TaxID=3900 RepID=A0A2Z6NHN1_TRISU|nr:hypothetical protein TSUD_390190 [Trifolium subterraneum]